MADGSGLTAAAGPALDALAAVLPEDTLRPAEDRHREELRRILRGTAEAVALPRSAAEVGAILAHCTAHRIAVVPLGGGTGLVGGQIADGRPALTLSLERMTAVRGLWPEEGAITVEAGAILQTVHERAAETGLQFPLTLGSKGSARIGGLLATNAGGTHVLRHGTMRDLCLGIEAVLPTGEVMATAHRLRKANLGYDLRHLMIGAEGTLGVITAATLRLVPVPRDRAVAVLALGRAEDALTLLARARGALGDAVTACELIDGQGLEWVAEHLPDTRVPLDPIPAWSVLLEAGMRAGAADALEEVAGAAMEAGLVTDGAVSRSEAQAQAFWAAREAIPEANRAVGAVASHDVSVPLSEMATLIREGRAALRALAPDLRFNTFGHVGDGNLHYNVFPAAGRDRSDYDAEALSRRLHDLVGSLGGAISAEHGIGRFKAGELARLHDPAALGAMRAIKAALDPAGIMNPGAILSPA